MQVNERTAEILATQRQLQATLGAIPDPLFEVLVPTATVMTRTCLELNCWHGQSMV